MYISLHSVDFYGFHVGKYTVRPMDPQWEIRSLVKKVPLVLVLYAAGKIKPQENGIFKVLKVSIKNIMHAERQKVYTFPM